MKLAAVFPLLLVACTSLSGLSGPSTSSDAGPEAGGDDGGGDGGPIGGDCSLPNATGALVNGVCAIRSCNPGYKDCRGGPADGCESYVLGGDLANCGDCGNPCAPANAVASCDTGGKCTTGACNANFGDCNKNPVDGCETTLNGSDVAHCGACDTACLFAQDCAVGKCVDHTVNCMSAGVTCKQASCTIPGRFAVTADVVVDLMNGRRLWQRAVQPPATYDEAAVYCSSLQLGGGTGWHLPTYAQLATLLYQQGGLSGCPTCDPATDQAAFPGVPSGATLWTTTAGMPSTYDTVNFCDGRNNYQTDITTPTRFRCVHDPL